MPKKEERGGEIMREATYAGFTREQWRKTPTSHASAFEPGFHVESASSTPGSTWRWLVGSGVTLLTHGNMYVVGERVRTPRKGFAFVQDAEAWAQARSASNHEFCYRVVTGDGNCVSFWYGGRPIAVPVLPDPDGFFFERDSLPSPVDETWFDIYAKKVSDVIVDKDARFFGLTHEQWHEKRSGEYPELPRNGWDYHIEARGPGKLWGPVRRGAIVRLLRNGRVFREGERTAQPTSGWLHREDAEAWAHAQSLEKPDVRYRVIHRDGTIIRFFVDGGNPFFAPPGFDTTTMEDMMDTNTEPLRIPREKLKEKIEEKLAANKKKWDDDRAEQQKRDQEEIDKISKALRENPVALLRLVQQLIHTEDYTTPEKFVEHLGNRYPDAKAEFVPDAAAEKLLRVLEVAANEEIEVRPTDRLYDYI